ncbi:hypothetical protein D3C80_2047020 [compost metagenome]
MPQHQQQFLPYPPNQQFQQQQYPVFVTPDHAAQKRQRIDPELMRNTRVANGANDSFLQTLLGNIDSARGV